LGDTGYWGSLRLLLHCVQDMPRDRFGREGGVEMGDGQFG
jgi:hypothetical protein